MTNSNLIFFSSLLDRKNKCQIILIIFGVLLFSPFDLISQVEEPKDDFIPGVPSGMIYTISEIFKNRLLEQRCHIEINDEIEIKEKKRKLRDFIKNNPDIGILNLKITSVPILFGKRVYDFLLIERGQSNRFINRKNKDTLIIDLFDDQYPFSHKFLVKFERNPIISPDIEKQFNLIFISGNMFLDSPYIWIKSFFSPEEMKRFLFWTEPIGKLIVKAKLFVFNSSEPEWDSLETSPYISYKIEHCDLADGKSCAIKIYGGGSHSYFNYGEIELVYYIKDPQKDLVRDNFSLDQIYEVKKIINDFKSVTAIPKYRPLPPEELQELIAKGKFYPYFHDN